VLAVVLTSDITDVVSATLGNVAGEQSNSPHRSGRCRGGLHTPDNNGAQLHAVRQEGT